MTHEEFCRGLQEAISRLEEDLARHEEYLAAAPSLEYGHFVVTITPKSPVMDCIDWTVRVKNSRVELQKGTTAGTFHKFMSRSEATEAVKKLRLVNSEGERVDYDFKLLTCRAWHSRMIEWERKSIEDITEILSAHKKEEVAA